MRTRRWLFSLGLCAALAVGPGCSSTKPGKAQPAAVKTPARATGSGGTNPKAIVTPGAGLTGKVASVNTAYQFVVITFDGAPPPAAEQKLGVYRASLKVGEVKVTGQQMGRNVVADLVTGEARAGDDVRPE